MQNILIIESLLMIVAKTAASMEFYIKLNKYFHNVQTVTPIKKFN